MNESLIHLVKPPQVMAHSPVLCKLTHIHLSLCLEYVPNKAVHFENCCFNTPYPFIVTICRGGNSELSYNAFPLVMSC